MAVPVRALHPAYCVLTVRVVKTTKQTHQEHITYPQALKEIIAKDGVVGLFGRGLQTRIITNGLQVRHVCASLGLRACIITLSHYRNY